MTPAERNALTATAGLALAGLGAFLPWARIGGRNRSGFNTADTFISLADGLLPDAIAWVGRWWYVPAFLAFVAWASTFLAGHIALRLTGLVLMGVSLIMWWLFVWAGRHYGVLDTQLSGPLVATAGLFIIGFSCSRRRDSLVRSP